MRFTVDYPPSLNEFWWNIGKRRVLTTKARAYKEKVGVMALQQRVKRQDGPLCVTLWLFRPRRIGDIDNFSKGLLDALKGIAWNDDSQIVEMHLYRGDDKENPRVTVDVQQVPVTGERR